MPLCGTGVFSDEVCKVVTLDFCICFIAIVTSETFRGLLVAEVSFKATRPYAALGCSGQLTTQEVANCIRNFLGMCLQCKVAGVLEIHFGTQVVTLEGLGARRQKERAALSPYREQRADDK